MKRFIAFTALLLSASLFLYHGTSFSKAEIRNNAILTIVPEENALIAITYGNGGNFFVKNNTAKAIDVRDVEVVNETDQAVISVVKKDSTTIHPGMSQKFTITGDPKILTGKVIQFTARWNGGSARINSIIPELVGNHKDEESIEENTDPEINEEDSNLDINEEENEVEKEEVIDEAPADSIVDDEIIDSDEIDIDEEK